MIHPDRLRAVAADMLHFGDITPNGARVLILIAEQAEQDDAAAEPAEPTES